MKLLPKDWTTILPALALWPKLSHLTRRTMLGGFGSSRFCIPSDHADQKRLREVGLFKPEGTVGHDAWTPQGRAFLNLMDGVEEVTRHAWPPLLISRYAAIVLDPLENRALLAAETPTDQPHLQPPVGVLGSAERINAFLALSGPAEGSQWERARRPVVRKERSFLLTTERCLGDAQVMLRALIDASEPVPIIKIADVVDAQDHARCGEALSVLIRYLLVFLVNVGPEMAPCMTLEPVARRRLRFGAAAPPVAVQFEHEECHPWLVADLSMLVAEAAARPIPLRQMDRRPHAAKQRQLAEGLADMPGWLEGFLFVSDDGLCDLEVRLLRLEIAARDWGMLAPKYNSLAVSAAGRAFLRQPRHEQWKSVIDRVRPRSPNSAASKRAAQSRRPVSPLFEATSMHGESSADQDALETHVIDAIRSLPDQGLVDLSAFFRYHGEERNPLLARTGAARPIRLRNEFSRRGDTDEQLVHAWSYALSSILIDRMLPLGCVRIAMGPEGPAVGLSPVGRYLLGDTDEFHAPKDATGTAIVQPNFEIVFLGPAPSAEAALIPLAERIGRGVGALFRLTRPAVVSAAEAGFTAETFLATLRGISSRPLPENVVHEVEGWFSRVRHVTTGPAWLMRCPDADTAARVAGIIGDRASMLCATIVEIKGGVLVAAERKRLEKAGVLVRAQPEPLGPDDDDDSFEDEEEYL